MVKSKSDGQVRIGVAPRPDELLDAACKRSIVQIVRIEMTNPKGFSVERKSAGRFARIGLGRKRNLQKWMFRQS